MTIIHVGSIITFGGICLAQPGGNQKQLGFFTNKAATEGYPQFLISFLTSESLISKIQGLGTLRNQGFKVAVHNVWGA
jgi:hypothetical protein